MNMTAEKNAPAFDTSVTIAGVTLKNPVMTASGTFGSGAEYSEFVDLNKLGAVVTKVLPMYHGRAIQHQELQRHIAVCSMRLVFKILV